MRPTGHLLDVPSLRDLSIDRLVGGYRAAPGEWMGMRDLCGYIADQQHESCVGEACSQALYTRMNVLYTNTACAYARMGKPLEAPLRPSSAFIWRMARAKLGLQDADVGCRPRDAFDAVRTLGYCDERMFPRDTPADMEPVWAVFRAARDRALRVSFFRIMSTGHDCVADIMQAIACNFPVCVALNTDQAYQDSHGVWTPGGARRGWHYVCALGYTSKGLLHAGSYGTGWGDNGFCLVPWDVIASGRATDFWAVQTAERPL